MPFVKAYDFDHSPPNLFRRLAASPATGDAAGDVVVVGRSAGHGLAARMGPDGAVLWSRTYSTEGALLSFIDVTAADHGDFLLLSTPEFTGPDSTESFLIRINGAGSLRWARRLSSYWNCAARVMRCSGEREEFLVVAWGPRAIDRRADSIGTLVRVGPGGALLGCAELSRTPNSDGAGRILDVVAVPDGYVLIGDAADPRGSKPWRLMESELDVSGSVGLCIEIGLDLNVRSACLINANLLGSMSGTLSPRSVLARSSNELVVTGLLTYANTQSTFAATVERGSDRLRQTFASVYDLAPGAEQPIRIDRIDADMAILDLADSSGRDARILRIDQALAPQAHHSLDLGPGSRVIDLRANRPDSLALAANIIPEPAKPNVVPEPAKAIIPPSAKGYRPVLLTVDGGLECCKTTALPLPRWRRLPIECRPTEIVARRHDATIRPAKVAGRTVKTSFASLCGVALPSVGERMVQSPYLNLQTAGSDGTDASRGVLLRWFLDGVLSEHLPKGNMAQNTQRFNKPDDFVRIYRARWPDGVPARALSFLTDKPVHADDTKRALYFLTGTSSPRDLFVVTFSDATAYAAARQAKNPLLDPAAFLAAYGANPFEIELRDVVSVACDLEFQSQPAGFVEVETRSAADNGPLAPRIVTSRRKLNSGATPVAHLLAENMRSVRVKCTNSQIEKVSFLAYDDVLTHVSQAKGWTKLGDFALTTDQAIAFRRLEDPARFQVHGHWRKFNDGACVNAANYKARWDEPANGLSAAVQTYRQLSETDPLAKKVVQGSVQPDDGAMTLSYLELLEIASFDYHVARMLGLGHVDAGVLAATSYIHVAEYVTLGDLEDGHGARHVQHLYMSLPTTLADARLPLVPELDGVEYGLTVPTGSGIPYQLTDPQGYSPDGLARYIKLYPGCGPLYDPEQGFFNPPHLFDLSKSSLPALYGVEYRPQGQAAWDKPEIAHDADFLDTRTPPIAEILTTPFPGTRRESGFIHKETKPGIHEYAVFGVNLFSRASPLSTTRATDVTTFRRRNTLLPPSDLQVQYIQKESPLVLTSASEQAMLASLPVGADSTLVRLSFNYGFAQEANYDFADKIQILHRRQPPGNVIGGVKATGTDTTTLRIELQAYTYSNGKTASPALDPARKPNFIGGVLIVGKHRLVIEDVWPGANPTFIVRRPTTTGVKQNAGQNTLVIENVVLALHPGDLAMAIENMAAATTWGADNPLTTTIALGDPSWNPQIRSESFTRADGKVVNRRLRGVWADATISEITPPATVPLRYEPPRYKVVFDTFVLGSHPQSNASDPVSWWKGMVRVPVLGRNPEDRRTLTVTQVFTTQPGGKFALEAVDDAGEQGAVATGQAFVNYYPGYKVYLHAESARAFDKSTLEPAAGEGSRTTVIGLRSVDNSTTDVAGNPYRSAVGVPQLVTAVEIVSPQPPQKPAGLKYATPSDGYGKSTYTFTIGFGHKPFGVVIYRADALSILEAMYNVDTTLPGVLDVMFPPREDADFATRFDDLFAFSTDTRTSMAPIPSSGGFTLPNPDAPARGASSAVLSAADKPKIREALLKAFVPLTEQPLIYDLVSTETDYVPTNRKQTFRDAKGEVLSPSDPAFDLSPMAKRPTTANEIQFTDFTLDGSMNPNTVYFYFACEIGNRMDLSDPSPIWGPVALVNLTPPSPPTLRKITTVPYDSTTGSNTEVRFEVIAPAVTDPMAKLRIYRTTDPTLALSVRTMTLIKVVDVANLVPSTDGTLTVADDFGPDPTIPFVPDPFIPYGEPLFYRLAWVREVHYEDAAQVPQLASVPSEPTRSFLASVIDVVNPVPPLPTVKIVSVTSNGDRLLRIGWNKAVHNGSYYISRLDPSGNWTRLGNVTTNDSTTFLDLQEALPVNDEDGDLIHYRFKVDVEGASGLLNTVDAPVIVTLDQLASI